MHMPCLKLDFVVDQANFLAWLERWQANVRAAIAAESVAKGAVTTRSNLALNSEVNLCQVVGSQLEAFKFLVGIGALLSIFSGETLSETTGAVLACATALAGLGLAFGSYKVISKCRVIVKASHFKTYGY